jgi:hypothetical protein
MTRAKLYSLGASLTLVTLVAHLYITAWMWDAQEYFAAVIADGDVDNDWLTHAPEKMQPLLHALGQALDALLMAAGLVS